MENFKRNRDSYKSRFVSFLIIINKIKLIIKSKSDPRISNPLFFKI